jgi:hypothetical protein
MNRARERLLSRLIDEGVPAALALRALLAIISASVSHAMVEVETQATEKRPVLTSRIEVTRAQIAARPKESLTVGEKTLLDLGTCGTDEVFSLIAWGLIRGLEGLRNTTKGEMIAEG